MKVEKDMTGDKSAVASHRNVYVALAAAQAVMQNPEKGAINPAFKGEGKPKGTAYADLADVVQAVRGPLNEQGIAYFHQMLQSEGQQIMRTSLVHGESDTRIDCDVPLVVDRNNMQGMKSATTYAKRIGLESVTGVAPEDDDGNAATQSPPPKNQDRQHIDHPRGEAPADIAIKSLKGADTLDRLSAIWAGIPRGLQSLPEVYGAKDGRKSELMNSPVDSGGDSIPY